MNRLKILFLGSVLAAGVMASCSRPKVEVPASVISADSMVSILVDMHLAEAAIQMRNLSGNDSLHTEAFGRYKFVLDKHKINRETFERSFRWYSAEPQIFSKLYDSVIVRLSEGQSKAQNGL